MLVIAGVVTLIGVTVTLTSISEAQVSLSSLQGDRALGLSEGCGQEALLYLNENNSLPSSIVTPLGSCNVTLESQTGSDWIFTVDGEISNHFKKIRIEATRSNTITINSWKEI